MGKIFRSKQADGLSSKCKKEGSSHFHGLKDNPNAHGIEPTGNECQRRKGDAYSKYSKFQRRGQRGNEVKLSSRAMVFSKARALKKSMHQNRCHKVKK